MRPRRRARGRPRRPSPPRVKGRPRNGDRGVPSRRAFRLASFLAVVGLVGTLVFGVLYTTKSSQRAGAGPRGAERVALVLDRLLQLQRQDGRLRLQRGQRHGHRRLLRPRPSSSSTASIRKALEQALAESRGQIRDLDIQSREPGRRHGLGLRRGRPDVRQQQDHHAPGRRGPPRADLKQVGGVWKISDVTVLEGATPASAGSASGSAGLECAGAVGRPPAA